MHILRSVKQGDELRVWKAHMDEKALVNTCTIINEGSKERPKVKAICDLESYTFFM